MHFAFILKTKLSDGSIWHMPWQRHGSSPKDVEHAIHAAFERDNIYAPGMKDISPPAELLDIIVFGSCEDGIEKSSALFDAASKKALKLDAKQAKRSEAAAIK